LRKVIMLMRVMLAVYCGSYDKPHTSFDIDGAVGGVLASVVGSTQVGNV
jgi:hypothetical protein